MGGEGGGVDSAITAVDKGGDKDNPHPHPCPPAPPPESLMRVKL